MRLPVAAVQALQVVVVLVFAPFVSGVIAHIEARLQGRRGPRVLQPYYDLAKLFRKETLVPEGASWVFFGRSDSGVHVFSDRALAYPGPNRFSLTAGLHGRHPGGRPHPCLGRLCRGPGCRGDGDPYAQLGSSRAMTFGSLIEPSVLFVVFTVALITTTDLPYAMAAVDRSSLAQVLRPAHLFAAAAFFLVVLSDTGRIPVETHASTLEFGMIDEARTFEHSGPAFALLKWGAAVKQLVLYVILIDVFITPWGLAGSPGSARSSWPSRSFWAKHW